MVAARNLSVFNFRFYDDEIMNNWSLACEMLYGNRP